MAYDYSKDPRYHSLLTALKPFNGSPRFYEILAQIACIHADKNHDYAGDEEPLANFHECERYHISAVDGAITRLSDKDARFRRWFLNRYKNGDALKVKDEKYDDMLIDRAAYTIILLLLIEEEQNKNQFEALSMLDIALQEQNRR
jgi:hypothetical protein